MHLKHWSHLRHHSEHRIYNIHNKCNRKKLCIKFFSVLYCLWCFIYSTNMSNDEKGKTRASNDERHGSLFLACSYWFLSKIHRFYFKRRGIDWSKLNFRVHSSATKSSWSSHFKITTVELKNLHKAKSEDKRGKTQTSCCLCYVLSTFHNFQNKPVYFYWGWGWGCKG